MIEFLGLIICFFLVNPLHADTLVPLQEPDVEAVFKKFGFVPNDVDMIMSTIRSFPLNQKPEFSTLLYSHGINFGFVLDRDIWKMNGVIKTQDAGLMTVPDFFEMNFSNPGVKLEATFSWLWILIPSSLSISDLEHLQLGRGISITTSFLKRSVVVIEAGAIPVKRPVRGTGDQNELARQLSRLFSGGEDAPGAITSFANLPENQNKILIFATKVGVVPGTLTGRNMDKISGTTIQSPLSLLSSQLMFPNLIFRQLTDWQDGN